VDFDAKEKAKQLASDLGIDNKFDINLIELFLEGAYLQGQLEWQRSQIDAKGANHE
jgi:hypothetical protein